MPVAFKLDQLQPVKPILLQDFSNIFTLILGEWINEFERQSLNRRNPSFLEPQLVKGSSKRANVLVSANDPEVIVKLKITLRQGKIRLARIRTFGHLENA